MSLDHEAIYEAYKSEAKPVVSIDDSAGAFDADGALVSLDSTKIANARASLDSAAAAIAYQSVRKPLYPSLGDFADAMYWNSKGDSSKLTAYYAACEKVKTDNPKPS